MNKLTNYFKRNFIYYIIALAVLALDLITKFLLTNKHIVIIENVISFSYSQNTGAAFSMFSNNTLMLIIISLFLIAGIVLFKFLAKPKKHILFTIAYPLILGGALGNLYDRIFLGYVRDFVSLDFINFAIFNLADSALCIGFALFAIYITFIGLEQKENTKKTN